MRVQLVVSLLFVVCACSSTAPAAVAAPVSYSVTMGTNRDGTVVLDGSQLTALSLAAYVDTCEDSTRLVMSIGMPATATSVSGSTLHIETDGTEYAYPGSSIHAVIDGTLAADGRSISGTVTLSDLETVFSSGCPPVTHKFVAIVRPAIVPPDPEHQWSYTGANLKVDATPGHVTRMKIVVPMACGNSVNESDFDTQAYAVDDIPVGGDGTFSRTLFVLDTYKVVRLLTITGQVGATGISARFQASTPDTGSTFLEDCVGDATFSATVPGTPEGPAAPAPPVTRLPSSTLTNTKAPPTATVGHQTLPRRSGPSAVFDWAELRLSRGAAYSYYFLVDKLRCLNHATHVRIVALGHAHRVPCGRRRGFASGPLPAGTDYRVSAQALRIRRGRIIRRGSVVLTLLHMRAADDGWVPITKLPGRPPRV